MECITTSSAVTTSVLCMETGTISTTAITTAVTSMITHTATAKNNPNQDTADENDPNTGEGKRKKSENVEENECKRRNVECKTDEMGPEDLMRVVLSEVVGIKNSIEELKSAVKTIQAENSEWNQKHEKLQEEVIGIKESVEMAHNLIVDEVKDRKSVITALKNDMTETARDLSNGLQVVKGDSTEIKTLKDTTNYLQGKVMQLMEGQKSVTNISSVVHGLSQQVDEITGNIKFPV